MGLKLQFNERNGDRRATHVFPFQPMLQALRQVNSRRVSRPQPQAKERLTPQPAQLTDLYRERMPVEVLNLTRSNLGLKVSERFTVNLPVLVEYAGLLVVATVRHCLPAEDGGYVLGLAVYKTVHRSRQEEVAPEHLLRFAPSAISHPRVARAGAA